MAKAFFFSCYDFPQVLSISPPHPPGCEENYSYILGHRGLTVPSSHLNTEDVPLLVWKGVTWGNVVGQDCSLELIFTFDSETFLLVFLLL